MSVTPAQPTWRPRWPRSTAPCSGRGKRSTSWHSWSLTVLEPVAGEEAGPAVAGVHNFLAPFLPSLFDSFGLPARLADSDPAVR